jgi:putative ABC transport system permease protein
VSRIDPHLPLYRVMTMKQAVEDALWNARASHRLILSITVIALALSMVGLYAVTAYSVGQRTQEIGIRVALGARPREIGALILSRALVQVTLGFVLGMGGGLVWDSTFVSGRIGLRLASPEVLAPVMTLLALLAIVACWVPVRRATRLDPVAALRHD